MSEFAGITTWPQAIVAIVAMVCMAAVFIAIVRD